jgi:hypothetical protein
MLRLSDLLPDGARCYTPDTDPCAVEAVGNLCKTPECGNLTRSERHLSCDVCNLARLLQAIRAAGAEKAKETAL